MDLRDTRDRYGLISRLNHWVGALLVIGMLGVGLYFHEMPRGDERFYWLRLHAGMGMLVLLPLAFRVAWRWLSRSPEPVMQTASLQWLTRVAHAVLLLSLALLLLSGPWIVWSAGASIDVLGLFSLPSPIEKAPALHELLEEGHAVVSRVLLVSLILHVLAVLKHAVLDRDGALGRMLGAPAQPSGS